MFQGPGCMYKNPRMSTHSVLEGCRLESPWDLEDLVREGRRLKCCPYFASRDLIMTADIVFCPYVYLIDPKIRNTVCTKLEIVDLEKILLFDVLFYCGLKCSDLRQMFLVVRL